MPKATLEGNIEIFSKEGDLENWRGRHIKDKGRKRVLASLLAERDKRIADGKY